MRLFSIALILTVAVACSDSDSGPGYSFTDQDATGKIGGTAWTYDDGFAEEYDDDGVLSLFIYLSLPQANSGCAMFFPDGDYVSILVQKKTGVVKFGLSETATLATFWDDSETSLVFGTRGAIEITSLTTNQITGKIDARFDKNTYINGNFTLELCPL